MVLGSYLTARATPAGTATSCAFDGEACPEALDFKWHQVVDPASTQPAVLASGVHVTNLAALPVDAAFRSPILDWLWDQAKKEWP